MLDILAAELAAGLPDGAAVCRLLVRLIAAMALGAVVGLQREFAGAAAGLRTHMLVTLGAALFVLAPATAMSDADVSRVVQGVATGIGFIGAGAVLKLAAEREIHGLTTAASIWLATATGVAVGLGRIGLAAMGVGLSWIILSVLGRAERYFAPTSPGVLREPSRKRSTKATTLGSGPSSISAK